MVVHTSEVTQQAYPCPKTSAKIFVLLGTFMSSVTKVVIKGELVIVPDLNRELGGKFDFSFVHTPEMLLRIDKRHIFA